MEERQNTLLCTFDPQKAHVYPRVIHEWIHEQLHVLEDTVNITQIDGSKRQVFIKFVDLQYVQEVLQTTKGQTEYKHSNGEISLVSMEMAGMGTSTDSQPALKIIEGTMRSLLTQYGEIRDIQKEKWSTAYRYLVVNGIRIVEIILKNT